MKTISIIIPIYNGEKYLKKLVEKLKEQEVDHAIELIAAVSISTDNSLKLAQKLFDISFLVENFNHAKTRHQAAIKSKGDILVFITQDIIPYNKYWLKNLVEPLLINNDIVATYSRQIAYKNATETEKLIRAYNYPEYDRLCNLNTIEKWGRKNIYYSDASSATLRNTFFELGGYNFEIGTNEDVVFALKIIKSGKSILYNSKSIIYHSHNFEIKSAYSRYKLIGDFERNYKSELSQYSSLGEGKKLVYYLVRELIKKNKIKELLILPIDLITRYIGFKKGYTNK